MRGLRKFVANFRVLREQLELLFAFKDLGLEEYNVQEKKDLPRMSYASLEYSVKEIQENLVKKEHLRTYFYPQGSYDASVFTENQIKSSEKYQTNVQLAVTEGTTEGMYGTFSFAYLDDNNTNCAFSVSYLRDDPDPEKDEPYILVEVEQRKLLLTVAIIKNTNGEPNDRDVTFFSDPAFLTNNALIHGEFPSGTLATEISSTLNSKLISGLLNGLFQNDDTLNLSHFNDLKARLPVGSNLDNCDTKRVLLRELIELAPRDMQSSFDLILDNSRTDIDFFKDSNFTEIISLISTQISEIAQERKNVLLQQETKLISTAIQCDLQAFLANDDATKSDFYQEEATKLRQKAASLSKNQIWNGPVPDLEFIEKKAVRIEQLTDLMRKKQDQFQNIYHNAEILKLLNSIKKRLINEDSFVLDDNIMDKASIDMDDSIAELMEQRNKSLKDHLNTLSTQLIAFANDLINENTPNYIKAGLVAKAFNLNKTPLDESYRDMNFKEVVDEILDTIKSERKKGIDSEYKHLRGKSPQPPAPFPNQSFLRRNLLAITLGVVSLVLSLGLIAALTGVLVPLGVTLIAGAAVLGSVGGVGIGVAAFLAVLSFFAGINIANNERIRSNKVQKYNEESVHSKDEFSKDMSIIKTDYHEKIQQLDHDFEIVESKIMEFNNRNNPSEHIEIIDSDDIISSESLSNANLFTFFSNKDESSESPDEELKEDRDEDYDSNNSLSS